jgi:hypothetical protein
MRFVPLSPLPVQTLDRDYCLLSEQTRQERKQGWSQAVIVNDIEIIEDGVNRTQEGMHQSIEVLRANRGQPDQAHTVVFRLPRAEIGPAVNGDVVSHFRQPLSDFLITGFDSAVLGNDPTPANQGHAQGSLRWRSDL